MNEFSRTELLLGKPAMDKLAASHVAVFGVGGVGSYAAEGLARSGIGKLTLVDYDHIDLTNINRQIHATHKTIGQAKVEVMKERIQDINPQAKVVTYQRFYEPGQDEDMIGADCNYIIDAMDTVTAKLELIVQAQLKGIPIISSMGAGNKLDPSRFEVDDIYNTSVCPLAKVMRRELRQRGIEALKVVYSREQPLKPLLDESNAHMIPAKRRQVPGSIAFVPSVAGLILAGEVVRDLVQSV